MSGEGISKHGIRIPGKNVRFDSYSSTDGFADDDPQLFADRYQLRRKAMNNMYSGDILSDVYGDIIIKNDNPVNQAGVDFVKDIDSSNQNNPYTVRRMMERYAHALNFSGF